MLGQAFGFLFSRGGSSRSRRGRQRLSEQASGDLGPPRVASPRDIGAAVAKKLARARAPPSQRCGVHLPCVTAWEYCGRLNLQSCGKGGGAAAMQHWTRQLYNCGCQSRHHWECLLASVDCKAVLAATAQTERCWCNLQPA